MKKNETKNLIEELTEDPDLYINLKTITERFVDIDNEFDHHPWDLLQILTQLSLMIPRRIGNNTVKELLDNKGESYRYLQDLKGGN